MDHEVIERNQVIEAYVMGRLTEAEADQFVDHYLTCEECLRRLELAERFRQGMRDVAAEELAPVGVAALFAAIARRRWLAGAAALALAAVAALSWQLIRLGGELDEAHKLRSADSQQAAAAEKETGALRQRLAAEERARSQLAEELSRERQPRAGAAWVVALVPVRSGPAAGEPVQRLTLPSGAGSIVLSLDMDLPGPGPYRIVLQRRNGTPLWEGKGLRPGPSETLAVDLDPSLLTPGDYRLLVEQEDGLPVGRFAFRVSR